MKKILFLCSILITLHCTAQKHNIVNASISLKNANKAKETEVVEHLKEAKDYIDEAFNTESTSNSPKMWNYRAPIYLQIALKAPEIDKDAIFKATEAYIKCLQKDKKERIIVRKWTSEEDILSELITCGYKLFEIGVKKYEAQEYASSLKHYEAIFDIMPLDSEDQLKRGNITKETVLYNSFFSSRNMKNNEKSKEILKKLIEINFNEPAIFSHLSKIYLDEGNNEKALYYIEEGRELFEDDQSLINEEINLYIALEKTDELITKLGDAIKNDPENEIFLIIRGTLYYQIKNYKLSEADFKKVIEIDPNNLDANYTLGNIFVVYANKIEDKSNKTNDNNKYEKLRKESKNTFKKSLTYLEKAYEIDSENKKIVNLLKQIYYKVGDYKKSEEMKMKSVELNK